MNSPMESDEEILEEAIKHLLGQGIEKVAISLGEKGSLVADEKQILRAKPPLFTLLTVPLVLEMLWQDLALDKLGTYP